MYIIDMHHPVLSSVDKYSKRGKPRFFIAPKIHLHIFACFSMPFLFIGTLRKKGLRGKQRPDFSFRNRGASRTL